MAQHINAGVSEMATETIAQKVLRKMPAKTGLAGNPEREECLRASATATHLGQRDYPIEGLMFGDGSYILFVKTDQDSMVTHVGVA